MLHYFSRHFHRALLICLGSKKKNSKWLQHFFFLLLAVSKDRVYSYPMFSHSNKGLSFAGPGSCPPLAKGIFCLILRDFFLWEAPGKED